MSRRASRGRLLAPCPVALIALACLPACSGDGGGGDAGIVVTTNILGDVTREIVGDEAEVTVLMKPNANPHSFGISAQQAAAIESAGLVVHNGLGLEEGVARNVEAAEDEGVPTLAVAEGADPLAHASGDSAGELDPHFWTDARRMHTAVELVSEAVIEHVDGVDADAVRANTEDYLGEVDALDTWMTEQIDTIPRDERNLVTNHHVFGYLADRHGFRVVGAVIPSGTTLASPSASDLDSLAGAIRTHNVPAVFADSSQPDRLAQVLAEEAGLHVEVVPLHSESLTEEGEGAATYLDMMRANTEAIVTALSADSR
ncbi:zinc ABC transporter substrate-binding protein AztC [Streptomyces johnsoniae]|uniref:Zinc ABC transporter substrate-binding protein AztC n=1 Tax=Streptomyces johnsoniae TaxID=3075532 RepID=A0ABU2S4C8_9ACTN|nr:zinc ABC transporter substrate-binding protein AztC [Streptomyces sp. DSM 41886]MDT0443815.1 zinc ABC transporter substrate-binding protein AztC [Streptomyces sp. DSM 41886]